MTVRQFFKLPVIVHAMQWDGTAASANEIKQWCHAHVSTSDRRKFRNDGSEEMEWLLVFVGQGQPLNLLRHWWVVRGPDDRFYECMPEIFDRLYRPVLDE